MIKIVENKSQNIEQSGISRRNFIKIAAGTAAALAVSSCSHTDRGDIERPRNQIRPSDGKLTYKTNPINGDRISILGYGCMHLPTSGKSSGHNQSAEIDQMVLNRSVDYAITNGINYFNTAPVYCNGKSEAAIGKALSKHPRESYFIATKCSNFDPDTWPIQKSKEMFYKSLEYLCTDYIDYYLLHSPFRGGTENFNGRFIDNGMLDFLKEQRAKGVIRNLGFSFESDPAELEQLMKMHDEGQVKWDFAQISLNFIDWHHAATGNPQAANGHSVYNELQKRGIPINAFDPLSGGALGSASRPVTRKMLQRRPNDSISSWAIRFVGSLPGILTIVSGMTYMEHLKDNLYTCSPLEPLSKDEADFLEKIALEIATHPKVQCIRCGQCMPCPYGVDIPAIFEHYNLCLDSDSVPVDSMDPDYNRLRRKFLIGHDRSVPKLRQASHCINCGKCLDKCPKHIKIPTQLARIGHYIEYLRSHNKATHL